MIHLFLIKYSYSYLIFPFKTRESLVNDIETNITRFFRSLKYNHIYINLEIGEPKQTIDVFLADTCDFYLSEKTKGDIRTNSPDPDIFDVNSDLNNFYDKNNSSTSEITNKTKFYLDHKGYISNDKLHFITDSKENIKAKIPFILYNSTLGNRPGVIGLQIIKAEIDKEYNFIDNLKENDVIKNYYWMINYTSENEGNFIIGEQPHRFDPQNYKEEDLLIAHPFTMKAMELKWGLRFDEITFGERNFRPYHECYFKYEYNYIEGIDNFEKELDNYFNESIQNGTCFKEKHKYYPYGPDKYYYCDKEKYKDIIKYFPSLKFYLKEMNYTFELNYKDLFIEKNDKLILMIFFPRYGTINWNLGKPFLKKYSFLMNQDSKIIGYYDRKLIDNSNNNNNNNITLKIILIVIGIIIILALGVVLGKFITKEKKRKNVMDDDEYDYTAKNDEIN